MEFDIFYHGNCPDGFGSALVAWLNYGEKARYVPVFHNQKMPNIESKQVIFLDFCYSEEVMLHIAQNVEKLIIIDHHQGIHHILKNLEKLSNVQIFYDHHHSGAVLAWKYFYPHQPIPKLLSFIEDRDCHHNQLEEAKIPLLWLDTQPFVFSLWNSFLHFDDSIWKKIENFNQPMIKKFTSMINKAAQQSVNTILAGYPAKICFGTEETASDIAVKLAQSCKGIGIVLVLQQNGSMKASLRTKEQIDLIPIAQKLGGNGHSYAAAFPCSLKMLDQLLNQQDIAS